MSPFVFRVPPSTCQGPPLIAVVYVAEVISAEADVSVCRSVIPSAPFSNAISGGFVQVIELSTVAGGVTDAVP